IADGMGLRHLLAQRRAGRLDRLRIADAGFEALFEQGHFGSEVFVAPFVEREALSGVAGLPRTDLTIARAGPDVNGAIGIDSPPLGLHDCELDTMPVEGKRPVSLLQ